MIKYGILGCGGHALRSHAIPGKRVQTLELAAIYDTSAESIETFCSKFGQGPQVYQDEDEFLGSGISAVVIATPDDKHVENLRRALYAGLHVLVEKPLANKASEIDEVKELLRYAAQHHLVVTSCHPRRFDPPYLWLKQNMPVFRGKFGPLCNVSCDFSYHIPRLQWKYVRSLLVDHFNHEVDLTTFLLGHSAIMARVHSNSAPQYEVVGLRADGVSFRFFGTRDLQQDVFREWVTLRYKRGEVRLCADSGLAHITSHESGDIVLTQVPATDYPARFLGVMQNFADTVSGIEENYLTPQDLILNTQLAVDLNENHEAVYHP